MLGVRICTVCQCAGGMRALRGPSCGVGTCAGGPPCPTRPAGCSACRYILYALRSSFSGTSVFRVLRLLRLIRLLRVIPGCVQPPVAAGLRRVQHDRAQGMPRGPCSFIACTCMQLHAYQLRHPVCVLPPCVRADWQAS
jgi:hypothetical protein